MFKAERMYGGGWQPLDIGGPFRTLEEALVEVAKYARVNPHLLVRICDEHTGSPEWADEAHRAEDHLAAIFHYRYGTPEPRALLDAFLLVHAHSSVHGVFLIHPLLKEAVVDEEDRRKVSVPDHQGRHVSYRWGRLLRKIRHDLGLSGPGWTDKDIDALANEAGMRFKNVSAGYEMSVVRGEGIAVYYDTIRTCMSGDPRYLRLYMENPERVGLLVIRQKGCVVGRALVWTTDSGQTVLDRVYPDNGGDHIYAARRYAEQQGWDMPKTNHWGAGYVRGKHRVTLRPASVKAYPQLDNMSYAAWLEDRVVISDMCPDEFDQLGALAEPAGEGAPAIAG